MIVSAVGTKRYTYHALAQRKGTFRYLRASSALDTTMARHANQADPALHLEQM
ncbi:MAG TPA: hypothetical protein VLG09_03905 [Candidatus Saccharimonadales bacterium]|nr:hypothetical protein [Candidatus Saccharimonadales bacterium]